MLDPAPPCVVRRADDAMDLGQRGSANRAFEAISGHVGVFISHAAIHPPPAPACDSAWRPRAPALHRGLSILFVQYRGKKRRARVEQRSQFAGSNNKLGRCAADGTQGTEAFGRGNTGSAFPQKQEIQKRHRQPSTRDRRARAKERTPMLRRNGKSGDVPSAAGRSRSNARLMIGVRRSRREAPR